MAKEYHNIRFANLIDEAAAWKGVNPKLAAGEFAVVKDGKNTAIVVGNGKSSMETILENPASHRQQIFYCADYYNNSLTLQPATANKLGGVKVPVNTTSGLTLSSDGTLVNSLINGYDAANKRFIINSLYVKNLDYDNKSVVNGFEGNTILLRDGQENPTTAACGIEINNLLTGFTGFLGLSPDNRITIRSKSNQLVTGLLVNSNAAKGYVTVDTNSVTASIKPMATLEISDGIGATQTFDPSGSSVKWSWTPPTIKVNGQNAAYSNGVYTIFLDGGLSAENVIRINKIDGMESDINVLKGKIINVTEGDKWIFTSSVDNKLSTKHNTITVSQPTPLTIPCSIGYATASRPAQEFMVIKSIGVDEAGHVTEIQYANITLELY